MFEYERGADVRTERGSEARIVELMAKYGEA